MKKIFIVFILIPFLLVGCQVNKHNAENFDEINSVTDNSSDGFQNEPLPNEMISIRSIGELARMREMISCTNKKELNDYLLSVEGGGAHSKDDLIKFIDLVDSIPYIALIDGDISWISYSRGQSQSTGEEYEILYVTTQSENGDWVRLEYILSVANISEEITEETANLVSQSLISQPIVSNDKKVIIHSETREKHVSGTGDLIKWIADIDGIYTNIVCYTSNAENIDTNKLLGKINLSSIDK